MVNIDYVPQTLTHTSGTRQCAAVRTCWSVTSDPPQMCCHLPVNGSNLNKREQ